MTIRENFLKTLHGETPDTALWMPRLDIWFTARTNSGTLPDEVRGLNLREAERLLGMGHPARKGKVFTIEYSGIEEKREKIGDTGFHTFITPVGEVSGSYEDSPRIRDQGLAALPLTFYLKRREDYRIMRKVVESMRFVPCYDQYSLYDKEVGDDGFPMVILGASPVHKIMLDYAGYEQFYYHLEDWPEDVLGLWETMTEKYREMWDVVARSPARFVMHGIHFSSDMTPPPLFKKYFMPYFTEFNEKMHAAGIKAAFHADADLTGLLDLSRDCGFDLAEVFACSPLVKTTFDDAWNAWKNRIVIWGGLPSIMLESIYPFEDFTDYVKELVEKTKGRPGFIMAVSDNIMPDACFDRMAWIRDYLKTVS